MLPVPLPRWRAPVPPRPGATVSVVIPCYNYGHFLGGCVGSVLSQPDVTVDVTIIDDASPDGSSEIAARIAESDDRVRLVRHRVNRGHIATYNEGLAMASGEFVVLISADDMLTPGSLGRAVALMQAEPTVGMVYGHPLTFDEDELPEPRTEATSWSVWRGRDWIEAMCRTGRNNIVSPEVVLRTELQHRIGGYRNDLPHSGDMEMWMRAGALADVGRVNGADQAYYRVHRESMMRTRFDSALADLGGKRDAFGAAFCGGPASALPGAGTLWNEANLSVARLSLDHACEVLDRGTQETDPVGPYVDLALSLSPGAPRTRQWRRLESRLACNGTRVADTRGASLRRAGRHALGRARGRAFRWSGL